jgi:sigma-B regulation protein RsbU (phosphoserine phosphatase)
MLDKYRLAVVLGDVSGKGIAAAMLMAVSKTLIKATAYKGMPADNVLYEVNNLLADDSPPNMFVTVFYGVLDTRNGSFEYSNGGHNAPFLISSDGNITQLDNIGGLLLGAIKDSEYESNIITLKPDDYLVLYTDGVTEAFNKDDEEYEDKRLIDSLQDAGKENAGKLVEKVIADVQKFSEGVEQSDDITCLALKYHNR